MIMLEGAKATTETVDALRTGASAMKAMQKSTSVIFYNFTILQFYFELNFSQFLLGPTHLVMHVMQNRTTVLCLTCIGL